jgi:hypothetical protein
MCYSPCGKKIRSDILRKRMKERRRINTWHN